MERKFSIRFLDINMGYCIKTIQKNDTDVHLIFEIRLSDRALLVESLFSRHEALDSIPSTT